MYCKSKHEFQGIDQTYTWNFNQTTQSSGLKEVINLVTHKSINNGGNTHGEVDTGRGNLR